MASRPKVPDRVRRALLHRDAACAWCCWPITTAPEEESAYRAAVTLLRRIERLGGPRLREPSFVLEIDHIVPLALGGANAQHNLRVLCHLCNILKGTRTDAEMGGAAVVITLRRARAIRVINRATAWAQYLRKAS